MNRMDNEKTYLETTFDLYREAATNPMTGLCCTTTPVWRFPGLNIPEIMLEMNYGCGSTVHPRDLSADARVLYIGVGGGMELLQFAYFTRQKGSIIGVDILDEMLVTCRKNLEFAVAINDWFNPGFVELRKGDALNLPVEDGSVDIVAQNCLFNIFKQNELRRALNEAYRVLKPHGKLIISDPVSDQEIPASLREDDSLRAMCISGAIPLHDYLTLLANAGFGTLEVRARRPYRVLSPIHYPVKEKILVESVEVVAVKDPLPADGPCVFTGKTAIYFGGEPQFDDGKGHLLLNNQPLEVCDKTAAALEKLGRDDIMITPSTWFYNGGGCC